MFKVSTFLFAILTFGVQAQVGLSGSVSQTLPIIGNNLGVTGWGNYSDTSYTLVSPLLIDANVTTTIPNNKGSVIETQKPADVSTFYNGTVITGRTGDGIAITFDAKIIPTNVNTTFCEVWFDIGGSIGIIYSRMLTFPKGTNQILPANFTIAAYTLDTWQANGATPYIKCNNTASMYNITYVITRTHKAR